MDTLSLLAVGFCFSVFCFTMFLKVLENAILENIRKCNFTENAEFHLKDSVKYAANTEKSYDFIFVDPFYDNTSHIFLMKNLEEILNPQGQIIFFHAENLNMERLIKDTNLFKVDKRRFGKSYFTILKKSR